MSIKAWETPPWIPWPSFPNYHRGERGEREIDWLTRDQAVSNGGRESETPLGK